LTQFSRALKSLDIEAIHANNSPQAKGRVERANQTLQDRLIKELRLQGINDLDAANALVDQFMAEYNARFAVAPQNHANAHRAVHHNAEEQALILSLHHQRKLSKPQLPIQNREYQLQGQGHGYRLRGATLTLCARASRARLPCYTKAKPCPIRSWPRANLPPRWMTRKASIKPWTRPRPVRTLAPITNRHRTTHGDNGPGSQWIRPLKINFTHSKGTFLHGKKGTFLDWVTPRRKAGLRQWPLNWIIPRPIRRG